MPPNANALDAGDPDGDDASKASKLAARAARFSQKLPGNRYKELEEMRTKERKVFEQQGLIKVGKTELGDAVDMRGTCERMCSEYEREFREYTREVHPFESGPNKRMDPERAVAAYSRSDAGAGHGDSAILPSDLRTPRTLVQTLDYLFSVVMPTLPPSTSTSTPTPRKALGYSAGFIRDRTRAIRKEFAMQSSWGHEEAIASFERIARWHILCLRELQEETGTNSDMHIDSAELGRCFVSLRQHYNDRREEVGVESPCPNEAEFRAYMLIYDLTSKSVSIPTSELPSVILDHPLVKLAWEVRRAAQRNFDSQKEGSKSNAELGMNLANRFVKLLKQQKVPYLMSCLVEIRLREMRRSAVRALTRTYPRLRADPIRVNEMGEVVERRMILIRTLDKILGCEEQDEGDPAWDDIDSISRNPDQEAVEISRRFGIDVYEDHTGPVGALVNLGAPYNDNKDAPFTRRWKSISQKRGSASYVDVVNGRAGVHIDGTATQPTLRPISTPAPFAAPAKPAFSFAPAPTPTARPPAPSPSLTPSVQPEPPSQPEAPTFKAFCPPPNHPDVIASKGGPKSPPKSIFAVGADKTGLFPPKRPAPDQPRIIAQPAPPPAAPSTTFTFAPPAAVPKTDQTTKKKRAAEDGSAPAKAPLFSQPPLFSGFTAGAPSPSPAGPSTPPVPVKDASPTLHTYSTPKPLSPAALPAQPSTTSPRAKKRSAASLLSSTLKPPASVLNRSLAKSYDERTQRISALPDVCDLLIDEVIESMIQDHLSSDLGHLVKQQQAATDYQRRKALRTQAIHDWTEGTFDRLLSTQTRRVAEAALVTELKRRYLVRRAISFWRSWARTKRENREHADKKRETMYSHLNGMGLSRSIPSLARSETATPISEIDISLEADRLDSLQIDIEINHAERTKDIFFAPSTFLLALTRHVSPLLVFDPDDFADTLPAFQTVLSVPRDDFGSPPDEEVTQWLVSKLSPPYASEGDDGYEVDGVEYDTCVSKQGTTLPKWSSIGLFVFEAPLDTSDDRKAAENIADAQDRLGALVKALNGNDNRYTPSLLVVTWEEESLQQLAERLEIQGEVAAFENKAIVSLQISDDLDERFVNALQEVIPEVSSKQQVVLKLEDVIHAVYPLWTRFTDIASLAIQQRPNDADLAGEVFRSGVELINRLPILARSALGNVKMELDLEATELPKFAAKKGDLPFELVDRITEYFEHDQLKGIDDLEILLAPMRQAAFLGHALPLVPALTNLSFLVWGEMKPPLLPLTLFYPTNSSAQEFIKGYLRSVQTSYEGIVDESVIGILPSGGPTTQGDDGMAVDNDSPRPDSTHGGPLDTALSPTRKKRTRHEEENSPNVDAKAKGKTKVMRSVKNARLMRALKDVERTLAELEENQSQLGVGVV